MTTPGTILYGMHFLPGVCEYRPADEEPFRVYVSDVVMREMGPSFAGRPVFVGHVSGLSQMPLEEIRARADGWVVESFFNPADGKHWVKFALVSEKGKRAIEQGMRLSNAYIPVLGGPGEWNMVEYDHEVLGGEYDHLALVSDPRYEESVVMTPDEFKAYNEQRATELRQLSNNKDEKPMAIKLFKRTKVEKLENGTDLESLMVQLKSGREVTITELVNEAEKADEAKKKPRLADGNDLVNMGEGKESMTVNGLLEKYNAACGEVEAFKAKNSESETDEDEEGEEVENEADEDDEEMENESDDEDDDTSGARRNSASAAERARAGRRGAADPGRARAAALANASERTAPKREVAPLDLAQDRVARGKARYGS